MTATTTTLDQILDEMEPTPITGSRALEDCWMALYRVPKDDPLYPRVEAAKTIMDALIRTEDWQPSR